MPGAALDCVGPDGGACDHRKGDEGGVCREEHELPDVCAAGGSTGSGRQFLRVVERGLATHKCVVAGAAVADIVARAAVESVVSRPAQNAVVALRAFERGG